MNLKDLENIFMKEFKIEELKIKTCKYIEGVLGNYSNNFLEECIDELPQGISFKDLIVQYQSTYILLNRNYILNPSFRMAFKLIEPNSEECLYIYEVEYDCYGEFMDEYLLDY